MTKIKASLGFILATLTFAPTYAHTIAPHLYANTISAHNIAAMQHSISQTVTNVFAHPFTPATTNHSLNTNTTPTSTSDQYGHAPTYGTMLYYGEYGDDGTISRGHSGGDTISPLDLNNTWIQWQHFGDDMHLHKYSTFDSDYDLITAGINNKHSKIGAGISSWGAYAGFAHTQINKDSLMIAGNGGYAGLYGDYDIKNFNISTTATIGALFPDSDNDFGTDTFTNTWLGLSMNTTYKIALNNTFVLQPRLFASYTWINSDNYKTASGHKLNNQDFHFWELAPGLSITKYISKGWFGFASVKYVFNHANGGQLTIDSTHTEKLSIKNYSEYGLGIQKTINKFNIAVNLMRRDGGRDGWGGGVNLKYIF